MASLGMGNWLGSSALALLLTAFIAVKIFRRPQGSQIAMLIFLVALLLSQAAQMIFVRRAFRGKLRSAHHCSELLSITYVYCSSWLPLCQIGMSRLLCAAKTSQLKARAKIPALSNCTRRDRRTRTISA